MCKASCGHKRAIQEMLATPEITAQLMETKVNNLIRVPEKSVGIIMFSERLRLV